MHRIFATIGCSFFLTLGLLAQPAPPADTCMQCHSKLEQQNLSEPAKLFAQDVHREAGLNCTHCHAGDNTSMDPKVSMDPKKGFVARPESRQIGIRCGKCHSDAEYMRKYSPKLRVDQWTEYLTSIHGQKNQQGDTQVATCISCHHSHGIKAIANPSSPVYPPNVAATCGRCHSDAQYMSKYKIPTDQAENYRKSVHAYNLMEKRDLSAPTCNDCHGNHGAAPPGVSSVSFVCGQCHTRQQKLFGDSPHRAAFQQAGLAACMSCHENHAVESPTDELLGTGEKGLCKSCHQPGEKGYVVGEQLLKAIAGLDGKIKSAQEILGRAERAGMEISKPKYQLNEAHEKLIQSRVLVHSVSVPLVAGMVNEGTPIAQVSYDAGVSALEEINFRRKGLLASAVFILMVALGLFLKIRKMGTAR